MHKYAFLLIPCKDGLHSLYVDGREEMQHLEHPGTKSMANLGNSSELFRTVKGI